MQHCSDASNILKKGMQEWCTSPIGDSMMESELITGHLHEQEALIN